MAILKSHHRLINPPANTLSEKSKTQLDVLLNFPPLLRSVWEWKEAFSCWYDFSPNVRAASLGFNRWCQQGELIDHDTVRSTLKTMRN
ncbi:transposase [Paenibacillus sp. 2TAB23]